MTKGRAVLPGRVVAEQEPFFITVGRRPMISLSKNISKEVHRHRDLSTALRFGRDDKERVVAYLGSFDWDVWISSAE
jgi:hypothetical protein